MTAELQTIATRVRGLARQVTEERIRAERTLATLRAKELALCTAALEAEGAALGAV